MDFNTFLREETDECGSLSKKLQDIEIAKRMKECNIKNLRWLNKYNIYNINEINPEKPPVNLPLKDLQNEMFQNDDIKANYSDDIVNNLERLWYIYCIGTFPHRVHVPAVKDELKEDELQKFKNKSVVFSKVTMNNKM